MSYKFLKDDGEYALTYCPQWDLMLIRKEWQ